MDSPLKVSVIVLTAVATVGVGFGGIQLYSHWNQVSVLNVSDESTDTGSLSYETRLAKGDKLLAETHYEEAVQEYQYAIELDAQNAEGFMKLGSAQLALHQNEAALENFKTAYTLSPSADSAAFYGHILMVSENWAEAQSILGSIPEANQKLFYEKALFNVVQNHPDQAKIELEAALQSSGPLLPATLQNFLTSYSTFEAAQGAENTYLEALLCKSLVDAQEYELASVLSKQVLTQKNDYRDVWMLLGYSKYKLEQYSDAEDAFRQAKKIDSLKPEVHYFLGSTLKEEAKYSDAIDELELALLYGFEPAEEAYKKIADGHEALQEWADAVAAYEALLNLSPSSVSLFQKPIELCLDQLKDQDRALTLAQKATSLFPSEALSHSLLAKVYLAQGKPELASSEIDIAFQIDSNFVLGHYLAGQVREAQNNPEGARWEYKKTFELSSEDDPLHSQAAERYNALLPNPAPQQ